MAALVLYATWGRRRIRVDKAGGARRRPWLGALVTCGLLMLGAPAYMLMANALGVSPEPVTVAGPVLENWSYKTTTYSPQILDDGSGAPLSIRVSPTEYRAVAVGTRFGRSFLRGRLGILYRWTFA